MKKYEAPSLTVSNAVRNKNRICTESVGYEITTDGVVGGLLEEY